MSNKNLIYENICLSPQDYNCFKGKNQLNDLCISFYYNYLLSTKSKTIQSLDQKIVFLDPAVVSNIYFDDSLEDLISMYSPLELENKDFIFIPINDNTDKFKSGGGTHWALMIYSKLDEKFIYIDSTNGRIGIINEIAIKIKSIMKRSSIKKDEGLIIYPQIERKQYNSYDCGVFVIEFTDKLIEYIISQYELNKNEIYIEKLDYSNIFKDVHEKSTSLKRMNIINIVNELL